MSAQHAQKKIGLMTTVVKTDSSNEDKQNNLQIYYPLSSLFPSFFVEIITFSVLVWSGGPWVYFLLVLTFCLLLLYVNLNEKKDYTTKNSQHYSSSYALECLTWITTAAVLWKFWCHPGYINLQAQTRTQESVTCLRNFASLTARTQEQLPKICFMLFIYFVYLCSCTFYFKNCVSILMEINAHIKTSEIIKIKESGISFSMTRVPGSWFKQINKKIRYLM